MPAQTYLILDYETYSEADLKKVGAYNYAVHPSTEILCAGWRADTLENLAKAKTYLYHPEFETFNISFVRYLRHPDVKIVAHNAFFEQAITRYVLARRFPELKNIPHERWLCTAARAAALALPRNLEGACQALGLSVQKDMEGHRLMLKLSKPRKPSKLDPSIRHTDPKDLARLYAYCIRDIDAETELFLKTPPIPPKETKVWCLDQKINFRGFHTDVPLVTKTIALLKEEAALLTKETANVTSGVVSSVNRRDLVLSWLDLNGVMLPDLRSGTVTEALASGKITGKPKQLLEIRQELAKSSVKKYQAFEKRAAKDARVRDILLYHAASTGRWGGRGVQPQNLPRPTKGFDADTAVGVIKDCDLKTIKAIYGSASKVFSNCIRSVITASPGKSLYCADYAAIEVRVLFWIAKHSAGVKAYEEDRPLYEEMAAAIYEKPVSEIDETERHLGKTVVLGCGYGLGHKKFLMQAGAQGLSITADLAELAVKTYRAEHQPVTELWTNLEKAAIFAVLNPTKKCTVNFTTWFVSDKFLYCVLPSGRKLAYYGPTVKAGKTPWGETRQMLFHWGVDPKTKKWIDSSTYGGKLTENVVQATARDLMAEAMLRIEDKGYEIVLSIHDELLAERVKGQGSIGEFERLMAEVPPWGKGCPVKAKGWTGERYRK